MYCYKEEFPAENIFTLLENMAEVGDRVILQIFLRERQILDCLRWLNGGLKASLKAPLWVLACFLQDQAALRQSIFKELEDCQASSLEKRSSFSSTDDLNLTLDHLGPDSFAKYLFSFDAVKASPKLRKP